MRFLRLSNSNTHVDLVIVTKLSLSNYQYLSVSGNFCNYTHHNLSRTYDWILKSQSCQANLRSVPFNHAPVACELRYFVVYMYGMRTDV